MHLERWAIDELAESTVILLRSVHGKEIDIPDTGGVKSVVMDRERELASDDWGEEDAFVLNRQKLGHFIGSAVDKVAGKRELPQARELWEGDVYWVVYKKELSSPKRPVKRDRSERFLQPYLIGKVEVWNVTAAARQAAKVLYTQAIERPGVKQKGR